VNIISIIVAVAAATGILGVIVFVVYKKIILKSSGRTWGGFELLKRFT